jgi:hypothetical protein
MQKPRFALILSLILLASCMKPTAVSTNLPDPQPTASNGYAESSQKTVDFEGVSFSYNPKVFGNVKTEVVPAQLLEEPDHKPDYVDPEHVQFIFDLGGDDNNANLAVYRLKHFPIVFGVSPHMVKYTTEKIEGLKRALKDSSYRLEGDIPHLPYRDAGDNFFVKVREFDFEDGDGIIFVTHWTHGFDMVSNRNLLYRFEGITKDGRFYVTAEIPVSVDFLPGDSPSEFEGFTYESFFKGSEDATRKRYKTYIESISGRLEKLKPEQFTPHLNNLETIISSLEIKR